MTRPVSCSSAKGVPKKLFHQHLMHAVKVPHYIDKHIIKRRCGNKQFLFMWSQVTDSGWNSMDGRLVPKLMALHPIPELTCQEVIYKVAPQPVKVSGAAVGGEGSNANALRMYACACIRTRRM